VPGPRGPRPEDRLLFILVYQKTHPFQTMHALQFGLSQPQVHHWIHRLLPVLQQALDALGHRPERQGEVGDSPLAYEGGPALVIDGTERRRQRPQEMEAQRAHYTESCSPEQIAPDANNHLRKSSVALVFQIRAIVRVVIDGRVGALTAEQLTEIYALLDHLIGRQTV
jgi:hypothetical protein